jgi:hypothetical protein
MKLSEAIRLGAMMKPKGERFLEHEGKTCALGAACDAVGISTSAQNDVYGELKARWPMLNDHKIVVAIWDWNDISLLTREEIADWVETIENQQTGDNHEVLRDPVDRIHAACGRTVSAG